MRIFEFFLPKTINFPDSDYNKNLRLIKGLGEPTLVSDDLIESGHLLTAIWTQGIKQLLPKSFLPKSILILGLGGGSNAMLVSKLFPASQITAVEIDPIMVKIANDHFGIGKIKNLKIYIGDAIKFVREQKSENLPAGRQVYDLVLVDCFVGKEIPLPLQKMSFIKKLYKLSRFTLINRIWWNEHHLGTVFFLRKLSRHFYFLKTETKTNIIVSLV